MEANMKRIKQRKIFTSDEAEDFEKRCSDKQHFVQMYEGDGLEILPESKYFNFKCCSCGLTHKITIERSGENIILKFYTIGNKL